MLFFFSFLFQIKLDKKFFQSVTKSIEFHGEIYGISIVSEVEKVGYKKS